MHDPVDPAFARAFQQSSLSRSVPAAFFEDVVVESLRVPALVATMRAMLDEDRSSWSREITAQTLLVWGDRDAFTGRTEQEFLVREIPAARLSIYAGAGHAPHWEDPRRVAGELVALIGNRVLLPVCRAPAFDRTGENSELSTRARLIMTTDLQGHALSGATAEAAAYYDQAVEAFNIYRGDPIASLTRATEIASDFAMAHVLRAHLLGLSTEPAAVAQVKAILVTVKTLQLNDREASHVAALDCLVEGDPRSHFRDGRRAGVCARPPGAGRLLYGGRASGLGQ
jgi:hypothetical protein